MDLNLTEEQRILAESAGKLVVDLKSDGVRPTSFDRERWRRIAEAGWLAIDVPEQAGGLALGTTELALVLEAAGRGLLLEPICAVAAAASAIGRCEDSSDILQPILAGRQTVAPVLGGGLEVVGLGDVVRLWGELPPVPQADFYLVPSRGHLCLVANNAPGLAHRVSRTVDGDETGSLSLSETPGRVLARGDLVTDIAGRLRDLLLLGTGAELLGVMARALEMALDYVKTRKQFDRPIGSFQAIQHRAVTDYSAVELTRSLIYQVCAATDAGHASPGLSEAVKAKASAAALEVTKSAIQMHGAIGYTDELAVGWHLKRAMTLAARYGNAAAYRAQYARITGLVD